MFEASGFQKNRDYFSQLPYENIDMVSGNLMLTFTDLVLPGNAGMDLRVQRAYNHNGHPRWSLGLAGIPLRVQHPDGPTNCGPTPKFPTFVTADGGKQTAFPRTPYPEKYPFPCDPLDSIFMTSAFWRWDRTNHLLQLPNGWTIQYSQTFTLAANAMAYAEEVRDPFNNLITIEWQGAHPKALWKVHQWFGGAERVLEFASADWVYGFPDSMTFDGRTWSYAGGANGLSSVTPPLGPGWSFDYSDGLKVTAPGEGETHYRFKNHQFLRLQPPLPQDEDRDGKIKEVQTSVVDTRSLDNGAPWTYHYDHQPDGRERVTVIYPDGRQMVHVNAPTTQLSSEHRDDGGYGVILRTLKSAAGAELEQEQTFYKRLPVGDDGYVKIGDQSVPERRTITRGNQTFATDYAYSTGSFGDYHRPFQIVESGTAGIRTTNFVHDYSFSRWMKNKTKSQTVSTPGGGSFTSSSEFDDNSGFKLSEEEHGIASIFVPTGEGNVGAATDGHGHTTSFSYEWGVVKNTTTPEYQITRTVNHDGSIAAETRRGLTTSYEYDVLGRIRWVKPPLGHWFETEYDNGSARWIRQARRSGENGSWTRFDLDGFGRLVATTNSVGVRTRREYDVYGRRTYESQPYTSNDQGRIFAYDDFDRLASITHSADGLLASYSYGNGLNVGITEHTGSTASRTTIQEWLAFGDPSDARLVAVTDGEGQTFGYDYDTIGNLREVGQPGGTTRTWRFLPGTALVEWEEHPESGRTTYTYQAGRLATKEDASGQVFGYSYDGNDRLTGIDVPGSAHDVTIGYDASDNRTLLENGWVRSEFEYDNANNLKKRRDRLAAGLPAPMDVESSYGYDSWDNLTEIIYPSGRAVQYGHDNEGRLLQVRVENIVVADVEQHHPTGAVARLRYGNGIVEQFTYDSQDRLDALSGGPVGLAYSYDRQGNVKTITSPDTSLHQTFTYDHVDRLRIVTGFGANEYQYDPLGNRTYKAAGNVAYAYHAGTKRLEQITGSSPGEVGTYSHDAVGNLEVDPSATYTYTPFNLVETVAVALAGGGTRQTAYRYDGDNQRKLREHASGWDILVHSGDNQLFSEFKQASSGAQSWSRDYVYLGSRLLLSMAAPRVEAARFASASSSSPEAGSVSVQIQVSTPGNVPVPVSGTLHYATSNGTATAGEDYEAISGSIHLAQGTPSGTMFSITVPIIPDSKFEYDESFAIHLTSDVFGISEPSIHTVTIVDDDQAPGLAILDGSLWSPTVGRRCCR